MAASTTLLVGVGALAAATAFVAMDFWAAFLHRRLWHGALWSVHRSHHIPRRGRFEGNDLLSAVHAPIAVVLIMLGAGAHGLFGALALGGGAGMTAFGVVYLVVHDGLTHRRLPVRWLWRFRWSRRIAAAHRRHHRDARGGPPYGLLFGPRELHRARISGALRVPSEPPSARPPEGRGPA